LKNINLIKNRFGLEGAVALITGGAQSLGFEIAQNLSSEGMKVAIADIQTEKGEEAAELICKEGGSASFFQVDLCSSDSIGAMVEQVADKYQTIDLLINNAQLHSKGSLEDSKMEDWEKPLKVILSGAFECSRKVISKMEKSGGGSVINISSVVADFVCGESADYHVGKAGLDQLTRYLAYHAGPKGVRVNGIAPGFIVKKENFDRYEKDVEWRERWEGYHPLKKAGYSEDLSNALLFMASDLAGFDTGQTLVIDGGLTLPVSAFLVEEYRKNL